MNRGWRRGCETDNTGSHAKKSERNPVISGEACLKQDAGRLQYIFRDIRVILIFLLYIRLWKPFEKSTLSPITFALPNASENYGRSRTHNIPSIKAAIVILLRYLYISTGWIASDLPICRVPISERQVCFPAVWFLVGMVIMGTKFRLVHPPLEWYTVLMLRTPSTTRVTILR